MDTFYVQGDEKPACTSGIFYVLCPRHVMYGLVATVCEINLHKLFSEGCV